MAVKGSNIIFIVFIRNISVETIIKLIAMLRCTKTSSPAPPAANGSVISRSQRVHSINSRLTLLGGLGGVSTWSVLRVSTAAVIVRGPVGVAIVVAPIPAINVSHSVETEIQYARTYELE